MELKVIRIFTVYFEGKYEPKYVTNLYRALKKYCKVPFEFVCLTDNMDVEADRKIPIYKTGDIKLHWHKLAFFSPLFGGQNPGDDIIIMDIDQVVVSDITDMINYPVEEGELISIERWWNLGDRLAPRLNGGFYKFKSGSLKCVWDNFVRNIEYWQTHFYYEGIVHYKYYGEQNFVQHICQREGKKITLMPGEWIGKWTQDSVRNMKYNIKYGEVFNDDYMIMDQPNPRLKLIHFANPNTTIHEAEDKWLKEYWQ